MKKPAIVPLCLSFVFAATSSHAIDLKQSKVTQVVNDVQIISAADQTEKPATINGTFAMPDILRTGAASRAELVAADETVTRVGANTIFSFDPANRTIDLKQGSLLFHSPHGMGGGTIHTGSATASVLGTTFITVTTDNGGLKVIDLEGSVGVSFANGLKQKLNAGMMTYVLPGANQLAPVVLFRLDELINNSLLVKGFNHPLDSLPLIQNQINKQIKLIKTGQISDTGLYAGDNANGNQVEVLDLNTISSHNQPPPLQPQQSPPPPNNPPPPPPPPPSLSAAEAADATINQVMENGVVVPTSLTDSSIPTPPVHVFLGSFSINGNNYLGNQNFSGFVAQNIHVNTTAAETPVAVDLTPYANQTHFDFLALNNFDFEGPATFIGQNPQDTLSLFAGNQFMFTPGISISAGANNFLLSSPGTMTFDDVSLANTVADINLDSDGDISLLNGAQINAKSRLILRAGQNISATDSQLSGSSALLTALSGGITLDGTTLNAPDHTIFLAPVSINLNDSTINSDVVAFDGTGNTTITMNNTTVNATESIVAISENNINITGDTVAADVETGHLAKPALAEGSALNADPASGTVSLTSSFGSINISGTSISAHYLTLNSGDGILLNAAGHTLSASGPGGTANFTAPFSSGCTIEIDNADLTAYGVVNMAANTINLYNVAFNGVVNLTSLLGIWNNGSVMAGAINDLGGVTWNGTAVVAENGTTGSIPGTGITLYSSGGQSPAAAVKASYVPASGINGFGGGLARKSP